MAQVTVTINSREYPIACESGQEARIMQLAGVLEEKARLVKKIKGEKIMLTSKQRAILRGKANTMDPVFIVGKGEIDETMIQGVKDCLDARELIKLKVLENSMYNAREAAAKLAEATGADCVQVIGSKFVLYLQKKKDSAYAALLK